MEFYDRKHSSTLLFLLLGIGLFNIADYFFTVQALSLGARELNPVVDAIVYTPLFSVAKLILIPALLVFIWTARHKIHTRKNMIMLLIWGVFVSYFAVTVYHLYWQYYYSFYI